MIRLEIKKYNKKVDKFRTGEEILPSDQSRIIEQDKFIKTYSPLGKIFEKQRKTLEDQKIKQVEALKTSKKIKNYNQLKDFCQKKW